MITITQFVTITITIAMHNNSAESNSFRDLVLANYSHCPRMHQMHSGKSFDFVTSSPPPGALKTSLEAPFDGRLLLPPKKAGKSVGSALHRRSSDYIDFSRVNSNSVDRSNKKAAAKEIQIPATIASTGTTGTVQDELVTSSQHRRNVASCENLFNATAGWTSPEMHMNESLHEATGVKKSSRKLKFLPKLIPNWFRKRKSSKNEKGEEVFISVQNLPNLRNRACTINNCASLEKLYEASRHEMMQQEVSDACCFSNHSRTPPLHPIGTGSHSGGVNCTQQQQQQQTSYQPILLYSSSPPPFNEYLPGSGGGGVGTGSRASHAQHSRKASSNSHSIYHQHGGQRVSSHSRENSLPPQMENVLYYPVFSSGVVEKLVPYYMGAAIHTSDFLEQHRSSTNGRQIHYISHVRGDPNLPAGNALASNGMHHQRVNNHNNNSSSSQCRHPKGQGHRSRSATDDPPLTSCSGAGGGQMIINDYHTCPIQQQQFFPHPLPEVTHGVTAPGTSVQATANGDRQLHSIATYSSHKEMMNTLTNVSQLQSSGASVVADDVIVKRVAASQFLDSTCIQDNSTVAFNSNNLAPFEGSSRMRRSNPYHNRQNETSSSPQQQQPGEQPKEQQRVLSMENSIAATNNQSVSSSPEHKSSGYATLDTANSLMVNHSTPRVNQLQALNSQSASSNRLNQSKSPSTKMVQSQCTTPTPTTKNKQLRIPLNDIHKQVSKPQPLGDNLESKCTQTSDYHLKGGQNNINSINQASTSPGASQQPIPFTNPNFRLRKLSVASGNNSPPPNSGAAAATKISNSNQVKSYFDFSSFSLTPPESMQMTIQQPMAPPAQFDKHMSQMTSASRCVQQSSSQESHIIYGQSAPGSPNMPIRTLKAPIMTTGANITSTSAIQNSPLWTRRKIEPPSGVAAGKDHDYSTITSKIDVTLQPRASTKKDFSLKGSNSCYQETSQSFYRSFEQDLRKLNSFFDSQGVSETVMKRFRKRSLSKFPSDIGSIPSLNEPRPQPVGPYVLSQHGLAENQLINPPMTEFDKTLLVLNWLMHCQKEIKLEKVCYF